MANIQTLRNCYTRLGFTQANDVSTVDDQGIDSAAELRFLKDGDIEALCKVVKKPGGIVTNPDAANTGQPARIPNPGNSVSLRAKNKMKLTSYFLRHQARISRSINVAHISQARVQLIRELKESEHNYEAPTSVPTISNKNWIKTLEAIEEHLRNHWGETNIQLAYVVCCESAVPDHATDLDTDYPLTQE